MLFLCAGTENRTPVYTLEECHSTIKLYPQAVYIYGMNISIRKKENFTS